MKLGFELETADCASAVKKRRISWRLTEATVTGACNGGLVRQSMWQRKKEKNVDRQTEEALYSRDRAASTLDSLLFSEYLYTCQNFLELLFVYWAHEPWLGKEEKFFCT